MLDPRCNLLIKFVEAAPERGVGWRELRQYGSESRAENAAVGQVDFDSLHENPRAALTFANNNVYLTWASSCDVDPYHGWVLSYDPQTLAQKAVLNVNPDGSEAGIWLSDTGPAVYSEGNLYVPTCNGTFDAADVPMALG